MPYVQFEPLKGLEPMEVHLDESMDIVTHLNMLLLTKPSVCKKPHVGWIMPKLIVVLYQGN